MRQKVIRNNVGSYLITLPKKWADNFARIHGKEIREVLLEVNNKLIIEPVLEEEIELSLGAKGKKPDLT